MNIFSNFQLVSIERRESYLIFLNLRLPSSTTFARPSKQALFPAIPTTTMESYLLSMYCQLNI